MAMESILEDATVGKNGRSEMQTWIKLLRHSVCCKRIQATSNFREIALLVDGRIAYFASAGRTGATLEERSIAITYGGMHSQKL